MTTLLKWPFQWAFIAEAGPQIPHCLARSSSPKCSRPLPCMNWTFSLWIDSSPLPTSHLYQAVGFNLTAKGSRNQSSGWQGIVIEGFCPWHLTGPGHPGDKQTESGDKCNLDKGQVSPGRGRDRTVCSLRVSRQVHSYNTLDLRNAPLDSFGFFQSASSSLPWHRRSFKPTLSCQSYTSADVWLAYLIN